MSKMTVDAELPNKNEQLSLQNTEILVKSNLMRMQLSELVSSISDSITSQKRNKIDGWLDKFSEALRSCETHITGNELSSKWLLERNLKGFELETCNNSETTCFFDKPESVHVVGSHSLNSGTSPYLNCDVAMVMPKSIFDRRDVLNHTYFNKRKLYIAAISEVLAETGLCSLIAVSYFKSDHRKPFLVLRPNFKTKYTVNLIPCAPSNAFKLVQLLPSRNNVRPKWWVEDLQQKRLEPVTTQTKNNKKSPNRKASEEYNPDPSLLSPTPHYNMAILEDLAIIPQYRMLTKATESCPCFRDVSRLLKVWLAQNNLRFGINDLGGHCVQIIVAYLFQARKIGQLTTVLGAFQMVLSFLAETNFLGTEIHFGGANSVRTDSIWPAKLYHPVSKDVPDVPYNSLWRISTSALLDLQNEAKIALRLLQREPDSAFNRIFLESKNFLSRYDLLFHIPSQPLPPCPVNDGQTSNPSSSSEATAALEQEGDLTVPQYLRDRILSISQRALGNRVKSLSCSVRAVTTEGSSGSVTSWDRQQTPINLTSSLIVTLGLVLNNENAQRRVDKGADTSADENGASELSMAAEEFRTFWGRKSELRRFKDGAIVDAVVWGEQDIHVNHSVSSDGVKIARSREVSGESIVEAIVRYALGMHLPHCAGDGGQLVSCLSGTLEASLPGTSYTRRGLPEGTVGVSHKTLDSVPKMRYVHAIEALDKLRSILTSDMKDLPLVFESITGSHASLRYTSTLPPMPHPSLLNTKDKMKEYSGVAISLVAQPMLIVGQVEGGGRWPTEIEAAKKVKTALLLRTGSLLRGQFEISSQPAHDHLDIFYRGHIFRLVIFFTSEDPDSMSMRYLQNSTLHHQSIRALHTQHSDSFSTSVRLLSLWLGKHFFSGFFSQRQVELLASAVYLDSNSLWAPSTPASALFRILDLLGKHEFDLIPLFVNFSEEGEKKYQQKVSDAFKAFQSSRKSEMYSLLAVSSNDFANNEEFFLLQDSMMEEASLSLIQMRARECSVQLMTQMLVKNESEGIFEGGNLLSDQCNIVLHFNPSMHCKGGRDHLSGPKFATLKVYANTVPASCTPGKLVVGDSSATSANTVQEGIVKKLRCQFRDVAIFFWDESDGDRVGVMLKPRAFLSSTFSSTTARQKISITEESKTRCPALLDISQIAMSMYATGGGCFSDITFC